MAAERRNSRTSQPSNLYLFAYNSLQAFGWSVSLFRILRSVVITKSVDGAYAAAGELICLLQAAAFLEVLHGALGIAPGEIWLMFQALPFIKKTGLYAGFFSSIPFNYYDFIRVLLLFYPFLWFKLYLHLFKQRRSKLGKRHEKKKN